MCVQQDHCLKCRLRCTSASCISNKILQCHDVDELFKKDHSLKCQPGGISYSDDETGTTDSLPTAYLLFIYEFIPSPLPLPTTQQRCAIFTHNFEILTTEFREGRGNPASQVHTYIHTYIQMQRLK